MATYNILAGDRGLEGIAQTLKAADADVIGLQEVDIGTRRSGRVDQAAALGKALSMQHAFVAHFPYQGGRFGVALLSRHPILRAERVHVKGSRLALLDATVRTPHGDVRVLVVHYTVTFPFRDAKETEASSAARLAEAMTTAALARAADGGVIVLGDMNDDTGSPTWAQFSGFLQDACDVKGGGLAKTWNSALPVTRIDYVWASRHFSIEGCGTLPGSASDHLPVVADLLMQAPP
ncbi:MAG: endonuclease/exonuclease/phosphatase family protein [Myxococcaceae bacterium]|nr:endonuclease/exonuclease/phosphatase family protein [Myxococcaceae bacterium]